MTDTVYSSIDEQLKLELIEAVEPNYGRMLWSVQVKFRGNDITDKLLGSWNKIEYDLSKFNFSSGNGYFFIPAEKHGLLVNIFDDSLRHIDLISGKHRFICNQFSDKHLAVAYYKSVYTVNLESHQLTEIPINENERVKKISFDQNESLVVEKRVVEIKGSVEKPIVDKITVHNN
jgi:uncharacterized protein (UPF0248 family)